MTERPDHRLNASAFGLTLGILWGLGVAALGVIARVGWGKELHDTLAGLYIGYDDSTEGVLVGAVWGFADALVLGVLFAWLYNVLDRR